MDNPLIEGQTSLLDEKVNSAGDKNVPNPKGERPANFFMKKKNVKKGFSINNNKEFEDSENEMHLRQVD